MLISEKAKGKQKVGLSPVASNIDLSTFNRVISPYLTETVGFEPTCRLPDKMISSHSRYGLFGTSPEQAYYSTGILSLQGLTKTPFNPMLRRLEP